MYPTNAELNISPDNMLNLMELAKQRLHKQLLADGKVFQEGEYDDRFPVNFDGEMYSPAYIQIGFNGMYSLFFIRGTWQPIGCKFDRFITYMRSSSNFDKVRVEVVDTGYLPPNYVPNIST